MNTKDRVMEAVEQIEEQQENLKVQEAGHPWNQYVPHYRSEEWQSLEEKKQLYLGQIEEEI